MLLALGQKSEWKLSELYTKKQGEEKELLEMSVTVSTNNSSLVVFKEIWLLHNAIVIKGVLTIIRRDKDCFIFELETDGYLRICDY